MLTFLDLFSDIFTHGSVSWHFCTETAKSGIFEILSDNFTHIKPVVLDSGSLFRYVLLLSRLSQKRRWKYVLSQANLTVPQTIYFSITSDIIKLRRSHLWSVSFWSPSVWNSNVIIVKISAVSPLPISVNHKKLVLVKSWLT